MKFLNTSESSLAEVGYCIHVAVRLGYITEALAAELESEIKKVSAPLAGLIRSTKLQIGTNVGLLTMAAYAAFVWLR